MSDTRDLATRVRAIAQRFQAQAIGYRKRSDMLRQDAENAERDAKTLFDAVAVIEGRA